jgi:diaminohydroxyphosphoribosylaminopyrimidine deaminase / 5-amino-6-(5-phosphoribosylamino)uracil reductase
MKNNKHKKYMKIALKLAKKGWGMTSPNPMVGAVIVKDGKIVGKGYHKRAGSHHAEINAIQAVQTKSGSKNVLTDSTIYITLEPCSTHRKTPPCTEAIIKNGIKEVVIGAIDPNPYHAGAAVRILEQNGISVISGIEEEKCRELNEAFFFWIVHKKPFVLLKMAMTLDGKIAAANGNSQWITGFQARKRVQKIRKWADAILIGGATARIDRPSLTVRNKKNELLKNWNQPRRLIASSSMTQAELGEIFPNGAELVNAVQPSDWKDIMVRLGSEDITSVLVEGGGELAAALLKAGMVNKVEFHIAPKILTGRNSRPVIGGAGPLSLDEALQLKNITVKKYGNDIAVSGYLR